MDGSMTDIELIREAADIIGREGLWTYGKVSALADDIDGIGYVSIGHVDNTIKATKQELIYTCSCDAYLAKIAELEAQLSAIRQAVDVAPPQQPYNKRKIADELIATAQGNSYYGNALYDALDVAEGKDKEMLHRYLHGSELTSDRIALQDFANRLVQQPEQGSEK